jgi:hypothetical protein
MSVGSGWFFYPYFGLCYHAAKEEKIGCETMLFFNGCCHKDDPLSDKRPLAIISVGSGRFFLPPLVYAIMLPRRKKLAVRRCFFLNLCERVARMSFCQTFCDFFILGLALSTFET